MRSCSLLFLSLFLCLGPAALRANDDFLLKYKKQRQAALTKTRTSLTLDAVDRSSYVYGLVMDSTFEKGSATLVTYLDGDAFILFSNDKMILRNSKLTVNQTARKTVKAASLFISQARPAGKKDPLPSLGQVRFYFLTSDGLQYYESSAKSLNAGRDPLSGLFGMCNELIGGLRDSEPK